MTSKLRDAREKKGWSQAKLAEKARVSSATISAIENQRASTMKSTTLTKLPDALGEKVTSLFF